VTPAHNSQPPNQQRQRQQLMPFRHQLLSKGKYSAAYNIIVSLIMPYIPQDADDWQRSSKSSTPRRSTMPFKYRKLCHFDTQTSIYGTLHPLSTSRCQISTAISLIKDFDSTPQICTSTLIFKHCTTCCYAVSKPRYPSMAPHTHFRPSDAKFELNGHEKDSKTPLGVFFCVLFRHLSTHICA
jgi:hypothetical protein